MWISSPLEGEIVALLERIKDDLQPVVKRPLLTGEYQPLSVWSLKAIERQDIDLSDPDYRFFHIAEQVSVEGRSEVKLSHRQDGRLEHARGTVYMEPRFALRAAPYVDDGVRTMDVWYFDEVHDSTDVRNVAKPHLGAFGFAHAIDAFRARRGYLFYTGWTPDYLTQKDELREWILDMDAHDERARCVSPSTLRRLQRELEQDDGFNWDRESVRKLAATLPPVKQ